MSTTYGPVIFPAVSKILQVNIAQATVAMIVENESLFDVLLSVSASTPQLITQANASAAIAAGIPVTSGGWDLHVGPRESAVLQIPAEALTASARGSYWTGTVWVQQVGIPNFQITAGSIVSNPGPNLWITAYGPGEQVPNAGITNLGILTAGQNRTVSIPVAASEVTGGINITPGATATWTNFGAGVAIGNYPFSNPALSVGLGVSGVIFILLYYLSATMVNLSAVAGTAEAQTTEIRIACFDTSSALVGNSILFADFFAHLALQSMCNHRIQPGYPYTFPMTVAVGAGAPYTLQPQMEVINPTGGGGTNIKPSNLQLAYDIAALFPASAMGGFIGVNPGSTYAGFSF